MTSLPEGYGFIEFISHEAAEKVLQSYNGKQMPGTDHAFILNWASSSSGDRLRDAGPDHSIFVGDLAPDVTNYLLRETFRVNYPSVRGAKVVTDPNTGRSKGCGLVELADEDEKTHAMPEMNGVYCSTRPMPMSATIPNTSSGSHRQYGATDSWHTSESIHIAGAPVTVGSWSCPVMDVPPSTRLGAGFLKVKSHMGKSPIIVGTWLCPVEGLLSPPLSIGAVPEVEAVGVSILVERIQSAFGSVQPTVTAKRKKKNKKRKKRTGSTSPTTHPASPTSILDASAQPQQSLLPVWSVSWSDLPCGCPWPVSPMSALNLQPTHHGLNHVLPDDPNEILVSLKPWIQRFYDHGRTIPCPHDLISLEAFKKKCPFSEPYVLYNGKEIMVTTDSGRFVLRGLVGDIITTFNAGFSWGGEFSQADLAVQIGARCYVSKVPTMNGTYLYFCKDLSQMADALIPDFRGVKKIPFIEHLYYTLKNPPPPSSTIQERQGYLKFLKSHPAYAEPLFVSSLVVGIVQTYKSMGLSDKKAFECAVNEINLLNIPDWRAKVQLDALWSKVYTAKERKSSKKNKKKKKQRYGRNAIGLSTFEVHGVQLMKTIDEVDYLVSDFFDDFIVDLFQVLIYNFDMEKDFLNSVWKMYDGGEDRKEVIKRIWKFKAELNIAPKTHEEPSGQSHVEASCSGEAMTN